MTSQCVDAPVPALSRGRRASRTGFGPSPVPLVVDLRDESWFSDRQDSRYPLAARSEPGSGHLGSSEYVERDWDTLLADAIRSTSAGPTGATQAAPLPSVGPSVAPSIGLGGLPPGVLDTRPAGVRLIDLREGVQVRDGVLDTRPHGLAAMIETPPSPFEVPSPFAVDSAVDVDVDTAEVRRIVSDVVPFSVTEAGDHDATRRLDRVAGNVVDGDPSPAQESSPVPVAPIRAPQLRRSELRRLEARAAKRSGGLSVPQVGIASALGLATIAAPLSGALSAPGQAGANQLVSSAASAMVLAAPEQAVLNFPQTVASEPNAVEAARVVVDDTRLSDVPSALAPPSRLLVTRASRGSAGRAVLPGCDGVVSGSALNASNGRLPASALCTLWDKDQKLRADAAVALAKLNVAYKQEFGKNLCVTDSYRTIGEQYTVKALRGGYAAAPGTSDHGNGTAIDLCGGSSVAGTATATWLRANGARYGWENPDWARTTLFEPWHYEYN